jgi:hypothetical protein
MLLVHLVVSSMHAQVPVLLGLHVSMAFFNLPCILTVQYTFILPFSSLLALLAFILLFEKFTDRLTP